MNKRQVLLIYLLTAILMAILYAIAISSTLYVPLPSFLIYSPTQTDQKNNYLEQDFLWKALKTERDELIHRAEEKGESLATGGKLFKLYPPAFTCPYKIEKVGEGFGGKWVCGLEELYGGFNQNCVVYSFGIFGDKIKFDEAMIKSTNCLVYGFDHTVTEFLSPGPQMIFEKIGLAEYGKVNINETFKTLKQLMSKHGHKWVDVLKVDVDGVEFDGLNMAMDDFGELPFGQLQVVIHFYYWLEEQIFSKIIPWFNRLESKGLRAFHAESSCFDPERVFEYSFINVNVEAFRSSRLRFFASGWGYMDPSHRDLAELKANVSLDLDGLM